MCNKGLDVLNERQDNFFTFNDWLTELDDAINPRQGLAMFICGLYEDNADFCKKQLEEVMLFGLMQADYELRLENMSERGLRKLLGLALTLLVRTNAKLGDISFQLDMYTEEVTDAIDEIYEDMQEQSKKDGAYN